MSDSTIAWQARRIEELEAERDEWRERYYALIDQAANEWLGVAGLTWQEAKVLGLIVRAGGLPVTAEGLHAALAADTGTEEIHTLYVVVCKMKRRLREITDEPLISTHKHAGYSALPALMAIARDPQAMAALPRWGKYIRPKRAQNAIDNAADAPQV